MAGLHDIRVRIRVDDSLEAVRWRTLWAKANEFFGALQADRDALVRVLGAEDAVELLDCVQRARTQAANEYERQRTLSQGGY